MRSEENIMGMYVAMMDEIERALEKAKAEGHVFVEVTRFGKIVRNLVKNYNTCEGVE
jgi:hypothetical protein